MHSIAVSAWDLVSGVMAALLFDHLAPSFRIHVRVSTPQHSTSSAHVYMSQTVVEYRFTDDRVL